MPDLSQNVRFLFWEKGIPRAEWTSKLTALLGWSEIIAEGFLVGDSSNLSDKELKVLARFGGVTETDLATKDLLAAAELDLFHENISFLVDLLPHGEKKRFAEKLGVDATTISRWKNGAQNPTKRKLLLILRYFGLPEDTDLLLAPVFLAAGPIGSIEMRVWLCSKIEGLDENTLKQIFPALKRMLIP